MNNSIGFKENLVPEVLNGKKTLTYRLGVKHANKKIGDIISLVNSSTDEVFANAVIEQVVVTEVKNLPLNPVGHEAYPSVEKLRSNLASMYGKDVSLDDEIVLIGFKLI